MRMQQANAGIEQLKENVDSLIIIPNERLKFVSEQKISFKNAFEIADSVLRQAVASISELITVPGFINLDFADVTSVMKSAGYAHMGVGSAAGKDKAEEAAKKAISSPLLETSIKGAHGVILSIIGSSDIGLDEIERAAGMVQAAAHPDAHIIFGASIDEDVDDEIRVVVIATGFDQTPESAAQAQSSIFTAAKKSAPAYTAPAVPVAEPAYSAPAAEPAPQPKAKAETSTALPADDPFAEIMKLFNK